MFAVKKVIFDLDGTLVDTAPDLHAATNHVLRTLGRAEISLPQVRHLVGQGAKKLMELGLAATGGIEDHDLDALLPVFLSYYRENIANGSTFYDGAPELLNYLNDNGYSVAICTNKPVDLARQLIETLGASEQFQVIIGGDSFPFRKPDPRHILNTIRAMSNHESEQTALSALMIGDTRFDIDAARAANIPSIAVDFGYSDIAATELGANAVVSHLSAVQGLLD